MEENIPKQSSIRWPSKLVSSQSMRYKSLNLLYNESKPSVYGKYLGFIVSCSDVNNKEGVVDAYLHKLEVVSTPSFNDAKMEVTHEVKPGLGSASQIIAVNNVLQVAGFDDGSIMEVKNFGFNKTFNSDVRNKLRYHDSGINCITANAQGDMIASGGTRGGEVCLYTVRQEKVSLFKLLSVDLGEITDLDFLGNNSQLSVDKKSNELKSGDYTLAWVTHSGNIGVTDIRDSQTISSVIKTPEGEPHINYTALCAMPDLCGCQMYLGGEDGEIAVIDLRKYSDYVYHDKRPHDGPVRRMKRILVEKQSDHLCYAYTNGSNEIQIYNANQHVLDTTWKCDRKSNEQQHDLIQVDQSIVSCGDKTSIGCWYYDSSNHDML